MRTLYYILAVLLFISLGCTGQAPLMPGPSDMAGSYGDGDQSLEFIGSETVTTPVREQNPPPVGYTWFPDVLEPHYIVSEEQFLTSDNGNQIWVEVTRPVWSCPTFPCHALVLVTGGIQPGSVWHAPWRKCSTTHWAKAGFICLIIDFQGRGHSEGTEDWNGLVHRQDLKTAINYINSRDDILPGGVGLVSSSWGCTVATATLADHPELNVRFYVDLEGAHNRFTSTQWNDPYWVDTWDGHTTDDDEFWDTREAITYMPFVTTPYIRVQSNVDHSFDYFYADHAIDMVNAAISGASPYARMNNNEPNVILEYDLADTYLYENIDKIDEILYMYVVQASMTDFE